MAAVISFLSLFYNGLERANETITIYSCAEAESCFCNVDDVAHGVLWQIFCRSTSTPSYKITTRQ